ISPFSYLPKSTMQNYRLQKAFNYMNSGKITRLALLSMLLLLFLPWEDGMSCFTYSKNYVWPLALIAWMIYLLFRREGSVKIPTLCLLGVFLGLIHEMAGLALCAACVVDWLLTRDRRMLLTAISAFVPSVVILLMGFIHRHEGSLTSPSQLFWGFNQPLKYLGFYWLSNAPWLLLGCLATVVVACRKKLRGKIDRLWIWLLVAAVAAGLQGGAVAFLGERVMWYCTFFSIVLCFHILNRFWPKPIIKPLWLKRLAFVGVSLLIGVNLVAGTIATYRMAEQEKTIARDFLANPSAGRFYDMSAVNHPTLLSFNRLSYYNQARHVEDWNRLTFYVLHGLDYWDMPLPIPADLQDITEERAAKIDGPNPCYLYRGWIATPGDIKKNHDWVPVRYAWGRTFYRPMFCTPFTASDGKQWTFIDFQGGDLYNRWSPITWIAF
ncbi:MAG: hypothetical protein LIP02_10600, partial [Bacteroidales bacterium]|nr:hypothetical protein [Bacteroidales bacterium]